MRQSFDTSVGTIEVVVDEEDRIVSAYRFDAHRRAVAAAIESWDYCDLDDVLTRRAGVPPAEASAIASRVRARHASLGSMPPQFEPPAPGRHDVRAFDKAGVALRFVAVLLDTVIVFFPLGIIVGLLTGGGYTESGPGYANAGVDVGGKGVLLFLALALGYYVLGEALTGMTLGKRLVGIQVVGEDGERATFGAVLVRNLFRPIDALFFYLVAAIFAWKSERGQRLGDLAANTVVVRR